MKNSHNIKKQKIRYTCSECGGEAYIVDIIDDSYNHRGEHVQRSYEALGCSLCDNVDDFDNNQLF